MSSWEEALDLGLTQAWEHFGITQSELADVAWEREVWGTLLKLLL